MIENVTNLYRSQDSCFIGELLLTPLKAYNGFFACKIEEISPWNKSSSIRKAAWQIAHIASGIFAYPILGSIALIGLVIKSTEIGKVKRHNEKVRSDLVELFQTFHPKEVKNESLQLSIERNLRIIDVGNKEFIRIFLRVDSKKNGNRRGCLNGDTTISVVLISYKVRSREAFIFKETKSEYNLKEFNLLKEQVNNFNDQACQIANSSINFNDSNEDGLHSGSGMGSISLGTGFVAHLYETVVTI